MHLRDAAAYSHLAAADPVLAQLIERVGRLNPFTWTERDYLSSTNFEIKALHIAGQQISTAAAMTIYRRVSDAAGGAVGPEVLLALPWAKAGYVQEFARRQTEGVIDQEGMVGVGDAASLAPLTTVRRVALWSAQTYAAALQWAFPAVPPRSAQGTAGALGPGVREEAR
jgi:DNA-3-methyladenine glycosylase II